MNRDNARAFRFLRINERPPKPRTRGVTEIRGPYYTPLGPCQLDDILETMGDYVDALKFAGRSFGLMFVMDCRFETQAWTTMPLDHAVPLPLWTNA